MKKISVWTIAVVAGLLATSYVFHLGSYVRTAACHWKAEARNAVPVKFEIERLRGELARIDNDVRNSFDDIAQKEVEKERVQQDVKVQTARLEKEKKALLSAKAALESNERNVSYRGEELSRARAEERVSHDFDAYVQNEAALKAKQKELEQRDRAVTAAKDRINTMRATRDSLQAELARLEAEWAVIELEQAKSKYTVNVDDSRIANIKESVQNLQNRVDKAKKVLELEEQYGETKTVTPDTKVKSGEVLKKMDDYFGGKQDNVVEQ